MQLNKYASHIDLMKPSCRNHTCYSVHEDHPLVGKTAELSHSIPDRLLGFRREECKIASVILVNDQIAGYGVVCNNYFLRLPKRYVYTDRKYVEGVHINSRLASRIKRGLSEWSTPCDYALTDLSGLEALLFELGKLTDGCDIEFAGWYGYDNSTRDLPDGMDWRYIIPGDRPVAVNCHSTLHDGTLSLTTTTYSTGSIDSNELDVLSDPDHWFRTLAWLYYTVDAFEEGGYDYSKVKEDCLYRLKSIRRLQEELKPLKGEVVCAYRKIFREKSSMPDELSIGVSNIHLAPDSVASYKDPEGGMDWGVITLSRSLLQKDKKRRFAIIHELIHASIPDNREESSHGVRFQEMADILGIPDMYQD